LVGSDVLPPTVLLLFPVQLNDVGVLLRLAEQVAAEVFAAALRLRRDASDLFLDGDYLPLETDAPFDGKVIAFARLMAGGGNRRQPNVAIAIAPHLVARMTTLERPLPLADAWKTARVLLPPSLASLTYTDVFTGARTETGAEERQRLAVRGAGAQDAAGGSAHFVRRPGEPTLTVFAPSRTEAAKFF